MRLGVLGGTFDPIHYGHLLIAEEARAGLQLDRVLFVPAKNPPHKLAQWHTPAEQRLQMVQLAIASNPAFAVSDIDLRRPGPSYTADTLAALQEEFGPEAELYFVMGMDSLSALLTWRRPEEIIRRARLVAACRPGYAADLQALEAALPGIAARTHLLSTPEVGIASHDLQRRVRQGLPIKYQVPDVVEAYIAENRLYGDAPTMTQAMGAGGCPA